MKLIPPDRVLEWILSFEVHPHQWAPERGFHSIIAKGLSNFVYSGNNFRAAGDKMVDQFVADSTDIWLLASKTFGDL